MYIKFIEYIDYNIKTHVIYISELDNIRSNTLVQQKSRQSGRSNNIKKYIIKCVTAKHKYYTSLNSKRTEKQWQ